MENSNPVETAKILFVQCENMSHSMNNHGGRKMGVMDQYAAHVVLDHNAPPLMMHSGRSTDAYRV